MKPLQRLEEAINNYLSFWRTKNSDLAQPIQAERLKNDFRAGALWQQEESKIDAYLLGFEAYKEANTIFTDEESLFVEYNNWYQKQQIN